METPETTIKIYALHEAKVMAVHSDPDRVVLRLTSGELVMHFDMHRDDFKGLAKRLSLDARLF